MTSTLGSSFPVPYDEVTKILLLARWHSCTYPSTDSCVLSSQQRHLNPRSDVYDEMTHGDDGGEGRTQQTLHIADITTPQQMLG